MKALKKTLPEKEYLTHPSRYALVELVNIHDKSLEFEAIHRVLFGVNAKDFISEFLSYCKENTKKGAPQKFIFCHEGAREEIVIDNPPHSLGVGTLQNFIDGYVNKTGAAVDYIHGEEVASNLGSLKDNLGIILEPISRSLLFQSVAEDGALPRKTFSMGEADEKRFYLEARRIKEQEHEHS